MPPNTPHFDIEVDVDLVSTSGQHTRQDSFDTATIDITAVDTLGDDMSHHQDDDLQRAIEQSRQQVERSADEELERALAASQEDADRHAAASYDSQVAAALAASKNDAPPGYFRSPEEEGQELQRALAQSAYDHERAQERHGAIADDDQETLNAVLGKSLEDWHKCTWDNPPPPEEPPRDRQGHGYYSHHTQSFYSQTLEEGMQDMNLGSGAPSYQTSHPRAMNVNNQGHTGMQIPAQRVGAIGQRYLPAAAPSIHSRGIASVAHSSIHSGRPPRAQSNAAGSTHSRAPSIPHSIPSPSRLTISPAPPLAPLAPTHISQTPAAAPSTTASRKRASNASHTSQSQAQPETQAQTTTSRIPSADSMNTTGSVAYSPRAGSLSLPTNPTAGSPAHSTPSTPSLSPTKQVHFQQSEDSKREAVYRAQQQEAYQASLAADREKAARKREREEEELRRQVEAEKKEVDGRDGEGGQEAGGGKGDGDGDGEEEEPDDPEFVKQKRLAFLERLGK